MSAVIKPGTNWTGDYSRFTGLTAEAKGYAALLKMRGRAVLDDEFNFLQEAILGLLTRAIREINGDGAVAGGLQIIGTGAANDFTIQAGSFYLGGLRVLLENNVTYSAQPIPGPALTTPGGNRTDEVYLESYLDEVSSAVDPDITDPSLGAETSRRLKLFWLVRVAQGGVTPAPYIDANGIPHLTIKLATIARTNTAAINSGMITDNRPDIVVAGSADAVIAAHEAAADPHPQYTTTAEAQAILTAHEGAADPHPQYTTPAEAAAAAPVQSVQAGAGITVSSTTGSPAVTNDDRGSVAIAAHEGAANPHPQYSRLAVPQSYTAGQAVTPVDVALSGGNYPCNLALSNVFDVLLTAAGTLTVASPLDGQTVVFRIRQDATGGWTLTLPANFRWGAAGAPVLTTTANAVNLVTVVYFADTATYEAVARLG